MRKELVLILIILMGGAVLAYNWFGDAPLAPFFARGVVSVENPTPLTAPKAVAAPPRKAPPVNPTTSHIAETMAPAQALAQAAAADPTQETPPAPLCCPNPDFPFPTPETLRVGSTMAEIRASYGPPAVDIAGTNEGHVVERYYYVNRERNRLTVANIENGLLISAESLSNPYFHLPTPAVPENEAHSK